MPSGFINTRTSEQAKTKVLEAAYTNANSIIAPIYPKLFNMYTSDTKNSFFQVMPIAELGLMKPRVGGEGGVFATDSPSELIPHGFTYSTMGLASTVSEEAQTEDPLNFMGMLPQMLKNSEAYTKEVTIWNILNQAFSPLAPGSDGLPLCSQVHPLGLVSTATGIATLSGGQTFSNSLGTAPLTAESFRQAEILFETLLTDRGNPDRRTPKYLVVGVQMAKIAQEVLGAKLAPYTAQNQPNTAYDGAEILVCRYITSPTAWFLCAGPGDWKGGDANQLLVSYKWENRVKAWYDNPTSNYAIKSSFRYAFGNAGWRGVVGSQGS